VEPGGFRPMNNFVLNSTLEQDSFFVKDLKLCQVRLMNNADYPWIILVPKIAGIEEITDLSEADYLTFNLEVQQMAKVMQEIFKPDKLNIAAIGNKVRQMHMHIIARYKDDKTFPNTVWGNEFTAYDPKIIDEIIAALQVKLINIGTSSRT